MYEIYHGNKRTGKHESLEAAVEIAKSQLIAQSGDVGKLHRVIVRGGLIIRAVFDDANGLRVVDRP